MSVRIKYDCCRSCRACYLQCPNDVIGWNEEENAPYIAYPEECSHCGVCALECKFGAIHHTIPLACCDDIMTFTPAVNRSDTFDWHKWV